MRIVKNKSIYNYLVVFVLLYLYHLKMSLTDGDDMYFSTVSIPYFEWIKLRYTTWSGRLFSETLAFTILGNIQLWKILNPLFIMVAAYGLVRLLSRKVEFKPFLVSLLILGYFSKNVISSAFFWSTGSIFYLWPIALSLVAMIPYSDYIKEQCIFKWWQFSMIALLAFLTSMSNEQIALCMSAFAVLTHISLLIKHKKQDVKLLFLTCLILVGTIILLKAPGNHSRWVAEVKTWYPGFDKLSLKEHLYIGIIWVFEKIFIDMKYLLTLFSVLICLIYHKNAKENHWYKAFLILLLISFSNIILGFHTDSFYDFTLIQRYPISSTLLQLSFSLGFIKALFPYVFWLVYAAILFYLIMKQSTNKWFVFLCLAASISTLIIMFFSPTIYASGNRVVAVCSVLWALVCLKLIKDFGLFRENLHIGVLSVFPILSFLQLIIWWFQNGYSIMY